MSDFVQLIVGLGNPGPEYEKTRHNAGQWFVEQLARRYNVPLKADPKYHGLTGKFLLNGQEVKLLIPTTYMNVSGKAVAAMAQFFKINPEQILVAHDEMAIAPGVAKFKLGGGHAGHNGLKDITSKLDNNANFYRLRLGIGHPGHKDLVTGYVLGKAPQTEQRLIEDALDESLRCLELWQKDGLVKAQHRLHSFTATA
ncbi:aminoacyl-tRNA hydrolase [Rheinheimera marina]|uniref:Peptidyl-tRNA hydrolase n=1 Tax=Rheinheimera marina TaxID=1774958 RepID=A0ABV9JN68_9GAMM